MPQARGLLPMGPTTQTGLPATDASEVQTAPSLIHTGEAPSTIQALTQPPSLLSSPLPHPSSQNNLYRKPPTSRSANL